MVAYVERLSMCSGLTRRQFGLRGGKIMSKNQDMKETQNRQSQAKAFIEEAASWLSRSDQLLRHVDWKGSVLASRQCMEDSVKALLLLLGIDPPKKHWFAGEFIEKALQHLPHDPIFPYILSAR